MRIRATGLDAPARAGARSASAPSADDGDWLAISADRPGAGPRGRRRDRRGRRSGPRGRARTGVARGAVPAAWSTRAARRERPAPRSRTIVRLTLFEALRRRILLGAGRPDRGDRRPDAGWASSAWSARPAAAPDARAPAPGRGQPGPRSCAPSCSASSWPLTAAFLSAPAIAADVESGVLLAMLARPLGGRTLVLGRWLGLAIVVAAYGSVAALLEIGAMKLATGYGPPDPLGAAGALAAQGIVVLTVALLPEQPPAGHGQRRGGGRPVRAGLGRRRARRRRRRARCAVARDGCLGRPRGVPDRTACGARRSSPSSPGR